MPNHDREAHAALGARIAALRETAGWSQEALAAEIKVSKAQVSKYEKGETVLGALMLKSISDALGLALDEFLGDGKTPLPSRSLFRKITRDFNMLAAHHQDAVMAVCRVLIAEIQRTRGMSAERPVGGATTDALADHKSDGAEGDLRPAVARMMVAIVALSDELQDSISDGVVAHIAALKQVTIVRMIGAGMMIGVFLAHPILDPLRECPACQMLIQRSADEGALNDEFFI